jgi:hypothetical protein
VDSNAMNFEEIIWGRVELAYMVQTETKMGFSKQVMKVKLPNFLTD